MLHQPKTVIRERKQKYYIMVFLVEHTFMIMLNKMFYRTNQQTSAFKSN